MTPSCWHARCRFCWNTREPNGQPVTIPELARTIGAADQTLLNLVNGHIDNPRLNTVRGICVFYGISLDYFGLEGEEQCRRYLADQQLRVASPTVKEIHAESRSLFGKAHDNILSMLEWMSEVLSVRTT